MGEGETWYDAIIPGGELRKRGSRGGEERVNEHAFGKE